jgi:hypothetical protein
MPAVAFELEKYFRGIGSVCSTRDNEDTAASLGHSEVFGIENPPYRTALGSRHKARVSPSSPWRGERLTSAHKFSEQTAEGVVVGVEHSGDVLPDEVSWGKESNKLGGEEG